MTNNIFSPWHINKLTISNRIIRSATWEGLADVRGNGTTKLRESYAILAANQVGLIISSMMYINPMGRILAPNQLGAHSDEILDSLSSLAEVVHAHGGLIAGQLAHAGGMTSPKALNGKRPLGPSAGIHPVTKFQIEALSQSQIEDIIIDFGKAALRLKKAGFDAVQLHMAHGFLISQFLSPYTNQRQDIYGGNAENRSRFALLVLQEVRRQVGGGYPVLIKINAVEEGMKKGLLFHEALALMEKLDTGGIDAIEVSGGVGGWASKLTPSRAVHNNEHEGYFFNYAKHAKESLSCPIISVGGWRDYKTITEALQYVDAIALSRPLICQPDLLNNWAAGDYRSAKCISCNQCLFLNGMHGLSCALWHK